MSRPARATAQLRPIAAAVQVWAYPLIFAQRLRLNFTQPLDPDGVRPPTTAGAPANRFGHARKLSDPALRVGVAPNVDTIYSVAWLDLSRGPFTVELPDSGDRYASLQVACSDTSSPLVLSRRTHPDGMPRLVVSHGRRATSSTAEQVSFSTGERWVMLVSRIGVLPEDSADLARVHELQDAIRLTGPSTGDPWEPEESDRALAGIRREQEIIEPAAFARALLRVLEDADASSISVDMACHLDALHLPELAGESLPAADVEAVRLGLVDGRRAIEAHVADLGRTVNGWAVNDRGADFGDDHLLRAAVAHAQIYVNPADEAVYPVCEVDRDGLPLNGATDRYDLVFAAGELPPVGAFWSLTMYHAAGQLVANPIERFAVSDRSPHLLRSPEGALRIEIGAEPPRGGTGNWLPAPNGPFRLMLRLYWPTDPDWSPPAVRRLPKEGPR